MPKVTIALENPVVTHDGDVRVVTVREPKARELFEYGEPFTHARNPDGTIYSIELDGVMKKYITACIDLDEPFLTQLTLSDGMAIKDAILGFFTESRLKNSVKSVTPSSST